MNVGVSIRNAFAVFPFQTFARRVCHIHVLASAVLLLSSCASDTGETERIAFNMGWLPQGSVSGIILAKEKGFYKEAGLDVSLTRGFGGIRTANEVDQGMFQFGYADPIAVLLNRAGGGQARLIGAINDRWPGGLCFVSDKTKLTRPIDLVGKTVGGAYGSPMQVLLPLLLNRNAVDPKSVNIVQLDPAVVDGALLEGVIDAAECWLGSNKALLDRRGNETSKSIGWMGYSRFGMDMYGSGLVASDKYLAAHPETARKFVAATYRGYQWVIANPDEAAVIIAKRYQVVDRTVIRQQIKEMAVLIQGPGKIGRVEPDRMKNTIDLLAQAYRKSNVKVEDIYTNKFLPE